jgi:hypothetical protein
VGVALSDHHVLLQVQAGLEEPWLGCDAEPTRTQYILFSSLDNTTHKSFERNIINMKVTI